METPADNPCVHPPARHYSWWATDEHDPARRVLCVACCGCGAVLKGGAPPSLVSAACPCEAVGADGTPCPNRPTYQAAVGGHPFMLCEAHAAAGRAPGTAVDNGSVRIAVAADGSRVETWRA